MTVAHHTEQFTYTVGEEVVFTLSDGEAIDLDRAAAMSSPCMPAWTIGVIVARTRRRGCPAYLVRFHHHDAPCLALAEQDQIEGTA